MNNVEAFALGATFGVGFEYTVGAGALISTGCPFNEYNGIYYFVRFPPLFSVLSLRPSQALFVSPAFPLAIRLSFAPSVPHPRPPSL